MTDMIDRIEPVAADLEDIQGLVYVGWNKHAHAGYQLARFGDAPARSRAWLEVARAGVTPAAKHLRAPGPRRQIALSASGLAALGVPADVREALAPEAQAGMASRQRSLSDSEPTTWSLGGPRAPLDVMVMTYASTAKELAHELALQRRALEAAGAHVYDDEITQPAMDGREHFGFADGLSQPFLPGLDAAPRPGQDRVPAGEILLGYRNAYDQMPISPMWGTFDLGRNGSYLVFRKLRQDVAGFWGWVAQHAQRLAGDNVAEIPYLTELLAAKLVGRWRNGAPVVLAPDHADPAYATPDRFNDFKYLAHDPDGLRCPISAHIRRANPRDARGGSAAVSEKVVNRHRILRRGRSFGAAMSDDDARAGRDDGQSRGLYFVCLQSSIARGFEFIQQTWLANPGFGGLHREPDPIVGANGGRYAITIPAHPVRLRLDKVPTVVDNVGGEYFLLPSRSALARIAAG